jgi:cysteine dioxygenase
MEVENADRFQYRERTIYEHQKIVEHQTKMNIEQVPVPKDLKELCAILHEVFSHDYVNVEYVSKLIENYRSNAKDWRQYAKYDPHKYTRNLIDAGNGKFNILLLCWAESQGSSIHDHSNSHCFMKCLDGELVETKFEWPKDKLGDEENESAEKEMIETGRTVMKKNQVCYINGRFICILKLNGKIF